MRSKGNYRRCGGRRERRQPDWTKGEGRRWRLARGRAGMKPLGRPPPRCRWKEGGRYEDVAVVVAAAAAADRGEEAMARFCPAPLDSWTASRYIVRSGNRSKKNHGPSCGERLRTRRHSLPRGIVLSNPLIVSLCRLPASQLEKTAGPLVSPEGPVLFRISQAIRFSFLWDGLAFSIEPGPSSHACSGS